MQISAASQAFGTNPNTGSTNGVAFVNDDPDQEYMVKADAAVTQANHGTLLTVTTNAVDRQKMVNLDVH